ncbi:hypothetical protein SMSP2_01428 [Limihaloglobus sulfuriphilus]|uniref:phosphoglycolate phosphatase n=1 Tax=Limihaloglobus sulfuriphilus TaxID=1851148 RepID=A0A1Q2MEI6_9BACT|nr:HAD hydrolase-like protein [Limihaloglobus sulfuriphilus]AQQ71064.1 hypothetical protein SMSP2_01428 [Limihaloglobus sulfuriphilus]
MKNNADILKNFKPEHDFFIGVDSDGCVFDSMGIKQRECFCPWMIAYFGLQPVAHAARQCKDFADLASKTRGANRHKTIVRILTELLPSHPEAIERGFEVPQFKHYQAWVADPSSELSDAGLTKAIENCSEEQAKKELQTALEWSKAVNDAVEKIVKNVPPFPYVDKTLGKMAKSADIAIISATPADTIEREWREYGILKHTDMVAGQEMGTKEQQLSAVACDNYKPQNRMMIGDALGDLHAARENDCLFFPIMPGNEIKSWKLLFEKAFEKFINGQYAGEYENELISQFKQCLPDTPSWQTTKQ